MILILTVNEDLHALLVQDRVRAMGKTDCHIVECDRVAQREFLTYGINTGIEDRVLTSENRFMSVSAASVLWLRRIRSDQLLEAIIEDEAVATLINNDCHGGLVGYLMTHFRGTWISTPEATRRAADKITQLDAAHRMGFRVPRTIVTQSRDDVLAFHDSCDQDIVVKTLVGAPTPFLQTVRLADPRALDRAAFAAAPAIFQENIPGNEHLRLSCFGARSYAALIRSENLDWRVNLGASSIRSYAVSPELHGRVRDVLDELGLEMGVVDIKITPEGEFVWLEVNPQGQFVFLDPLTDLDLVSKFASYLIEQDA